MFIHIVYLSKFTKNVDGFCMFYYLHIYFKKQIFVIIINKLCYIN